MTTNRMGLEQSTLSDERLNELSVEDDLYNYPPTQDELNGMARELLVYRKASKEPVGEVIELSSGLVMDGVADVGGKPYRAIKGLSAMKRLSMGTKFYTAPQIQAVTVPDEMTPEMMRAVQLNSELGAYAASNLCGAYDLFAEFWKVACRAVMLKSATNEP